MHCTIARLHYRGKKEFTKCPGSELTKTLPRHWGDAFQKQPYIFMCVLLRLLWFGIRGVALSFAHNSRTMRYVQRQLFLLISVITHGWLRKPPVMGEEVGCAFWGWKQNRKHAPHTWNQGLKTTYQWDAKIRVELFWWLASGTLICFYRRHGLWWTSTLYHVCCHNSNLPKCQW